MKGVTKMGTFVCKCCDKTVGHFEDEKVTTLYVKDCEDCQPAENEAC